MKRKSLFSIICLTSFLGASAMAGGDKLSFAADDADGNGAISQRELVASIEDTALFDRIDVNDNSVLEKNEAEKADLVDFDDITDTDKGGLIEVDEFAVAVFAKYDDDNDNVLDADEYEEYSEQVSDALQS